MDLFFALSKKKTLGENGGSLLCPFKQPATENDSFVPPNSTECL
jgi:hypothetical protein